MERVVFGKTKDGEDVHRITIENGKYMFSVLTWGATLCYFGTKDCNVVLNHKSLDEYIGDPSYMGEVVGPVANRVANAYFSLDGKSYSLDKNNGRNNLHSGSACYGQRLWSVLGIGINSISLALSTSSGLGGFPGSHEISVTYSISNEGELGILYRSISSEKCPVAITNHSYFNLSKGKDIRETLLSIDANSYVAVDEELIPTGVEPVEATDFDFRKKRRIRERRDGKYDNTFVLGRGGMIFAEGEDAWLEARTSEPGVQLYTGEFLSGDYTPFSGFCLETGRYPDTPNHDDYPKAFTGPDEEFVATTTYKMGVK